MKVDINKPLGYAQENKHLKSYDLSGDETDKRMCIHCGREIRYRNISGFCDHLYYPENCDVCTRTGGLTR